MQRAAAVESCPKVRWLLYAATPSRLFFKLKTEAMIWAKSLFHSGLAGRTTLSWRILNKRDPQSCPRDGLAVVWERGLAGALQRTLLLIRCREATLRMLSLM